MNIADKIKLNYCYLHHKDLSDYRASVILRIVSNSIECIQERTFHIVTMREIYNNLRGIK